MATGLIVKYFQFSKLRALQKKDLKDNKDNSLHLGRKYARIFVLGHYLFLVAHCFPRAPLSENCSLLGTDDVRGQISEQIFAPNGDCCLYNNGKIHPALFLYFTIPEAKKIVKRILTNL